MGHHGHLLREVVVSKTGFAPVHNPAVQTSIGVRFLAGRAWPHANQQLRLPAPRMAACWNYVQRHEPREVGREDRLQVQPIAAAVRVDEEVLCPEQGCDLAFSAGA